MVKIQKPIPKKMGKPNLENPIKKKKQEKEKSASVKDIKAKLESPIKEVKAANQPGKKLKNEKPKVQNEVLKPEAKKAGPIAPGKVKESKIEEAPEKPKAQDAVKKGKKGPKNGVETKVDDLVDVKESKIAAPIEKSKEQNGGKMGKKNASKKSEANEIKGKVVPLVDAKKSKIEEAVEKLKEQNGMKTGKKNAAKKPEIKSNVVPLVDAKKSKVEEVVESSKEQYGVKTIKKKPEIKEIKSKVLPVVDVKPVEKLQAKDTAKKGKKAEAPVDAEKKVEPIKSAKKQTVITKEEATVKPQPLRKGPLAPPATPEAKNKKKKNKSAAPQSAPAPATPKTDKKIAKLQKKKQKKLEAKKAELATKGKGNKQDKKEKKVKEKKPSTFRFDPVPFDEEKFHAIVNSENIKKVAEALKIQVEQEVATKKSTIFEDYRYLLQIDSFKIPNAPKRMVKLNVKHPLVDKDDDVLLVVPDLQRGAKFDFEPTLHHYQDLLRAHDIEGITVMPMNQLRKEYTNFESKRRLFATYDHFMCDGRIVSHVVGFVGKITQKPRHTFHAVRLNNEKNIKREIEKTLRRTAFRQVCKGTLTTIPIGTHKFTSDQIVDNVEIVIQQLKNLFPGGLGNIRNLFLKIDITGTSALPLYISMGQAPDETPNIIGPREQRMVKLKKEANEVLSKFVMTKEGHVVKLNKPQIEKKRKLQEMKVSLVADEVSAKKAKKEKKDKKEPASKTKEVVEEIELPESGEDDDDNESGNDDDDVQVASSDEDEESISQADDDGEVDSGSEAEIVENGIVDDDENEDSDEEGQQNVDDDSSGDDDVDDDGDEDECDDEEEEEESD